MGPRGVPDGSGAAALPAPAAASPALPPGSAGAEQEGCWLPGRGGQSGEGKNCCVGNNDPHHPPQLPNFPRPAGFPGGAEFEPRLGQRQPGYLRQSAPGPGCGAVRGGLASASPAAGLGPGPSSGWAGRALPAPLPPPMSGGTRAMRASPEEPASRSGRARYI